jgi:hypothetical protein
MFSLLNFLTAGAWGAIPIRGRTIEIEPAPALPGARRDEFSVGLEELQVAVAGGCAAATGAWASRFASGIRAALDFAAANPAAARALVDGRAGSPEADAEFRELIDRFSAQLRECAPDGARLPISSEEAVVENIAGVVNGCLHSGGAERIEEMAPYLIYLALLPYVGSDEAWRWSGQVD